MAKAAPAVRSRPRSDSPPASIATTGARTQPPASPVRTRPGPASIQRSMSPAAAFIASRNRTGAVTWRSKSPRTSASADIGEPVTLETIGRRGPPIGSRCKASAKAGHGRGHQRGMKRVRDGQASRRPAAASGPIDRRLDGAGRARDHGLAGGVEAGDHHGIAVKQTFDLDRARLHPGHGAGLVRQPGHGPPAPAAMRSSESESIAPAQCSEASSPRLWPTAVTASMPRSRRTPNAASEAAMIAGWATSVERRSPAAGRPESR